MVDDPLRLPVEERGRRVDGGNLAVHQSAVPLLQEWQGISQQRSKTIRELPDRIASKGGGGHGKADIVREVA